MTFSSFAYLAHLGIKRPSLAAERFFYWSKLYKELLDKRGGKFTTLKLAGSEYRVGEVYAICLDRDSFHLFSARITSISQVKVSDLSDGFIKSDADMTREELITALKRIYKKQRYDENTMLDKISLVKV
jgi:hypothetical protein